MPFDPPIGEGRRRTHWTLEDVERVVHVTPEGLTLGVTPEGDHVLVQHEPYHDADPLTCQNPRCVERRKREAQQANPAPARQPWIPRPSKRRRPAA